jgi:hypothetical protein
MPQRVADQQFEVTAKQAGQAGGIRHSPSTLTLHVMVAEHHKNETRI